MLAELESPVLLHLLIRCRQYPRTALFHILVESRQQFLCGIGDEFVDGHSAVEDGEMRVCVESSVVAFKQLRGSPSRCHLEPELDTAWKG